MIAPTPQPNKEEYILSLRSVCANKAKRTPKTPKNNPNIKEIQ